MRLLFLLLLLSMTANLAAQSKKKPERWIGLTNTFYKNKDVLDRYFVNDSSYITEKLLVDHQLSLGLSLRKVNKNGVYQQLDLFELNWIRDKERRLSQHIASGDRQVTRGREIKEFSARIAYQQGKLFPIVNRLKGDIGLRAFAWYKKNDYYPLTPIGFPLKTKSVGLGLNLDVGLNYQVHKNIIIGYNFIPISARVFWNDVMVQNPILTSRQKIVEQKVRFDQDFFKSILDFRNFHINYVF